MTVLGELPSQLRLRWPVKEVGARVAEVAQLEKKRVHLPKSRPEHKEATIGDSLPMARSLLARRIFLLRIGLKWIVLLPLVCVLPFGRSSFFFFFNIYYFFFYLAHVQNTCCSASPYFAKLFPILSLETWFVFIRTRF